MARFYQSLNQKMNDLTLEHVRDLPNLGGCIVECPHCKSTFASKDIEECPKCNADLVYPNCDW